MYFNFLFISKILLLYLEGVQKLKHDIHAIQKRNETIGLFVFLKIKLSHVWGFFLVFEIYLQYFLNSIKRVFAEY